uniref:Tropomyosin alpha-3 chain-like n=1 Tax=Nicotiana tabacum TaxID=4097 RepID=A0A1S3XJ98_TOBAC|nr:PREDICTED: tropomyosin alpha-3 chain-like [Nicotiana tabacum]
MYKLLSEQREGEVKTLRAELDAAQKEHATLVEQVKIFEVSENKLCMATNGQNLQVQQKLDRIDQLRAEMDEVKAMAEVWKGKIDRLASKKETAWEQLDSAKSQLRAAREKAEAQSQNIEDLQFQLGSAAAERDTLAKELKAAKLVAEITRADAEEMVAQYKADVEAAQDRLNVITNYLKWQSRKEDLKEVYARGFDLMFEIENVKSLEAEAKKFSYPEDEEGFEGSGGSEGGEDSDGPGDEAGSGKDQA